jgi:hypothetical protein
MVASLWGSVGMGQKTMSQVLGAFGLLDFTVLWPVLAWRAFLNLQTDYFFNFPNFSLGRGQPWIRRSSCTCWCTLFICPINELTLISGLCLDADPFV